MGRSLSLYNFETFKFIDILLEILYSRKYKTTKKENNIVRFYFAINICFALGDIVFFEKECLHFRLLLLMCM